MNANENAFEQGIEPQDDPFAGTDVGDFQQEDPLADAAVSEQPVEGVPLVNAEGEPVNVVTAESTEEEIERSQMTQEEIDAEYSRALSGDEPDPTGSPASSETQEPQSEASPAAQDASAPAASPEDDSPSSVSATETGTTEAEQHESAVTADGSPADAQDAGVDPTPAPTDGATTAQSAEEEQAPPPAEVKDKKGVVTHRPYVILTPDGEGKWREVHWWVDKGDKMVKKGTPGAKRQRLCSARGQEEALAVGYNALGSPDGGVKLVAIAETYFQPKQVEPDPVPVTRQRLKIR